MYDAVSIKKENGKLICTDHGGHEMRNPSLIWLVQKADEIYKWPDFPEFVVRTADYEKSLDEYTFSKQNSYHNLVPDFNYHAWPAVGLYDYEEITQQLQKNGLDTPEMNKLGWIGNSQTNIRRTKLVQIGSENSEIMDIHDMRWSGFENKLKLDSTKYISTPDLVKKYAILIDIEGNGYSGRLKYLLWSRRPVIIVDRPHKEIFFKHLIEWVHYIPVKRDLEDLVEKVKWCIDNYERAKDIGENAYEFAKEYLTRERCYMDWDELIQEHIRRSGAITQ